MPYVPPDEAINAGAVDLAELLRGMGPLPCRRALVGTDTTRWVLWAMPSGFEQPAHKHPRADEVFHVLRGQAVFRFAGDPAPRTVGPGTLLLARRGVPHAIGATGPEPLVLMVSVTPNEDAADETVEVASL
jgi:quercetin dioxygenase-like cupin family protein